MQNDKGTSESTYWKQHWFSDGRPSVVWQTDENGEPIESRLTEHEVLKRCRSVMATCLRDRPEDLLKPERRSVIQCRILEITEVLERAKAT